MHSLVCINGQEQDSRYNGSYIYEMVKSIDKIFWRIILICPYCQHTNRDTANFCLNCGERITVVCLSCDARLPISANFCDHCGDQVGEQQEQIAQPAVHRKSSASPSSELAPRRAKGAAAEAESALSRYIPKELVAKLNAARTEDRMVGERRVVTMMFCDVMGSTAAAEQLDPEDWTEVINKAFEFMIKPVYKYEGMVARLMGDAILAFFGAPIAHEDDPQRAALAGLDIISGMQPLRGQIKREYGIDFNVRIGINTGTVVVGAVGSDLRMEYTALGDAVNVASRLETAAEPGTILISQDTQHLIKPSFDLQEMGELSLKGKAAPLRTYRVIRRRRASDRRMGIAGNQAPLIGRDHEFTQLKDVLAQAEDGIGRIVSVISEAGLGKSRLIGEALSDRRNFPDKLTYQINCRSYESSQAYSLIRHLLHQLMGIEGDEAVDIYLNKLDMLISSLESTQIPTSKWVLQTLIGLELEEDAPPLEGEAFKRELYRVTDVLFESLFSETPAVLVFEDIHWSDSASIELLQHLLPFVEKLPLVMTFSFRPDRGAPSWTVKQKADEEFFHRYTEIRLSALSHGDSNTLINSLLADPDIPERMREQIIDRSGGNPFFIEEVLRTLIDNRVLIREETKGIVGDAVNWYADAEAVKVQIPDSLQSLLTARIDLLDEDVHQTLQLASVIGRRFQKQVLVAVSDEEQGGSHQIEVHLGNLMRLEMIDETVRQPEVEYSFRNPMIQETAYKSILKKRRRELHLRVAESLENLYPDQLNELAPLLGYHYAEGTNNRQALKYYIKAGDNAYRLYANALAISHYNAALEQAKMVPGDALEELVHLYSRCGRALELESRFQEATDLYEDELALARQLESPQLELQALVSQGTVYSMASDQADPVKAELLSKQALDLAEGLGDKDSQARILWNLMNIYRLELRPEEGIAAGKQGLALALESGDEEISAYIYNDLSYVYLGLLETQKAYHVITQAIKRWRELNNQPMLVDSLSSSSSITIYLGKYEEAIAASDEAARISRSINNPWGIGFSRMYIGSVYEDRGEISQALSDYETTYKMGVESGFHIGEIWGQVRLAHLYIELNDFEKASEYIDRPQVQAWNYSGLQGMFATMMRLEQTALEISRGDLQKATKTFNETDFDAAATYIYTQDYIFEVQARLLLASEVHREARQFCLERIDNLEALNNKSFLHQMYLFLGTAHIKLGEYEQSKTALNNAYRIADELQARWRLWQILAAQAELAELQGKGDNGKALKAAAVAQIEAICVEIDQPDLRESFLNRQDVASLLEGQ